MDAAAVFERTELGRLVAILAADGYRVIGPTRRGTAIVYGDIAGDADFAIGLIDEQEGGTYRLREVDDPRVFNATAGQTSCRQYLFAPRQRLWSAERTGTGFRLAEDSAGAEPPLAFIGVRACDLAAVGVQDRVFGGHYPDPRYMMRRRRALIVAVACARAGNTCFCASMGGGPEVGPGHDLALTELVDGGRHVFVAETGSERGALLLARLDPRPATGAEIAAARAQTEAVKGRMGREMVAGGPEAIRANPEHPRWHEVAGRCLTCTNCTLVCPTCFCSTAEDVADLGNARTERWQRWDSCFTLDFSYIHGGSVRKTAASRYRQWITHKLSTWWDQFGMSGCVGCGRCIAWCPVGIDITEEARAIRDSQ
ncbi:MAG: 4Fe-4S dicluster domain-containing protein [Magnetospirillum sp.]|nr:4Fe-4S dicluster domain-containing protein [Magnetospirillum sp.]